MCPPSDLSPLSPHGPSNPLKKFTQHETTGIVALIKSTCLNCYVCIIAVSDQPLAISTFSSGSEREGPSACNDQGVTGRGSRSIQVVHLWKIKSL